MPVSLCTKRRFVVVELDRSLTSVPSKERLCVRACFVLLSAPVHLHPVCVWHNVSVSIVLIHQQKGFPSGFPHCCLTENFSSQSAQTHTSGERKVHAVCSGPETAPGLKHPAEFTTLPKLTAHCTDHYFYLLFFLFFYLSVVSSIHFFSLCSSPPFPLLTLLVSKSFFLLLHGAVLSREHF